MKKIVRFFIFVVVVILIPIRVYAQEHVDITNELGIDTTTIDEGITPEVKNFIDEKNISVENTEVMTEITPTEVLVYIWDTFKGKISEPLQILASLLAIMLLSVIVNSMEDSLSNKSTSGMFGTISVLISVGIISSSVSSCIDTASETLISGSRFMIGYVPVFAGITASSGSITSATAYNLLVILVSEGAAQLFADIIVPVLSLCMAIGIIEAINPDFHLSGITEGIKKGVTFVIGFVMVVFIGLMSLQSIIGASADTLGVKAAKYMVSNWIPFIGGAIADTYTTVKHSLGLLRSGAGFLGIAVVFVMVIPPIIEIIAMRMIFSIADIISDLFNVPQMKILLKNTGWILSITFSIMTCFAVMFIISTTMLMLVGLNVS